MIEDFIKKSVEDYISTLDLLVKLVESTKPKKVKRKIRYKKNGFKIQKGILVNPIHEYLLHEASFFVKLSNAILRRS